MYILKNRKIIKSKIEAKNIKDIYEEIFLLPKIKTKNTIGDIIKIQAIEDISNLNKINQLCISLKPWRKGPFLIMQNEINSEWDSSIKFNIIKNHLDIKDKDVADIGCNNGYYMFRMLGLNPKSITGFDPSALCKCQFDFINHFMQSNIQFELLGIEDLVHYDRKFDFIICLGVLYHRTNPIDCLKIVKQSLNKNGVLILDSIIIDSNHPISLSPMSYASMKNVYFIPSKNALQNWLKKAGFKNIEIIAIMKTTTKEQRKTKWIDSYSLEDFLDSSDSNKTIEGYPSPTRIYIRAN